MRRKARLYLETSVVSRYWQEDAPPLLGATREFWRQVLPRMKVYVSDMVILEVRASSDAAMRDRTLGLISEFEMLSLTDDSRELAKLYLRHRRLPEADANHIAIASLEGMDFLVTWNLRHLMKAGTQAMVRQVNMSLGLPVPHIVTPEDFLEGD